MQCFNSSFSFLESHFQGVRPWEWLLGVFVCCSLFKRSHELSHVGRSSAQGFVEPDETPHVFDRDDVLLFGVDQGIAAVGGRLELAPFLPDPAQEVHLVWEDVSFWGRDFDVCQGKLLKDQDVVAAASCCVLPPTMMSSTSWQQMPW